MEERVKVTRKYQVTIPKAVREKIGVKVGDELKVVDRGDTVVLRKVGGKKSLLELAGCWRGYPEEPDEFFKELRKLWSIWKV